MGKWEDYEDAVFGLYELMNARARGQDVDPDHFTEAKDAVLNRPELAERAPRWLKRMYTLAIYWSYIKPIGASWDDRTKYLTDEFESLFDFVRSGETAPAELQVRGGPKAARQRTTTFRHPSAPKVAEPVPEAVPPTPSKAGNRVFLVHGHDQAARNAVELFLRSVGLDVIVLAKLPDGAKTVIEKFEANTIGVDAAVVLMTPDDFGGEAGGEAGPRARQNVVLELGYFIGKLTRSRVVALKSPNVEEPSDVRGVLYVSLDDHETWKRKLAQELDHMGLQVDMRAALGA